MSLISKDLFVRKLSEKLGSTMEISKAIYDTFGEIITESIMEDNDVALYGIGKFVVKQTKERIGYNPYTKQAMTIPPKKAVSFKVSKTFVEKVIKQEKVDV